MEELKKALRTNMEVIEALQTNINGCIDAIKFQGESIRGLTALIEFLRERVKNLEDKPTIKVKGWFRRS